MAAAIIITTGSHRFEFNGQEWASPTGDGEMVELLNRIVEYPGPSMGDPLNVMAAEAARIVGGLITYVAPHPKTKGDKVY